MGAWSWWRAPPRRAAALLVGRFTSGLTAEEVSTDDVLAFSTACRQETVRGRPGPNVIDLNGNRTDRLAPGSINLRLAAVAGLYEYLMMRDPTHKSPIPKSKPSNWFAAGERSGLLAHIKRRPAPRSRLRVRTPRRLPRSLTPAEVRALLGSLRSTRDLAMAGLMLHCGPRSCEVLALAVTDVDIGGRWLLVHGKGGKDRRVPLDGDLAASSTRICSPSGPMPAPVRCSSWRKAPPGGAR